MTAEPSLVRPRPTGGTSSSTPRESADQLPPTAPATVQTAPVTVLARVPDLGRCVAEKEPVKQFRVDTFSTDTAPVSKKSAHNDSHDSRPAYARGITWPPMPFDREALVRGLIVCWTWAIGVPPIVKLGAATISLVAIIWLINRDPGQQVADDGLSTRHQAAQESSPKISVASGEASRIARRGDDPWRWDATKSAATADAAFPTKAGAPAEKTAEPHGITVPVTVQPLAPYRQPHSTETNAPESHAGGRIRSVEASPQPPHMPERWSERPGVNERSEVPGVQFNQYVAERHQRQTPPPADTRTAGDSRADVRVAGLNGDPDVALARRRAWEALRGREANDNRPAYDAHIERR